MSESLITYPIPIHSKQEAIDVANNIIRESFAGGDTYCNPEQTKKYLTCQLGSYEREVFAAMFLNSQHQLLEFKELFQGTVDSASVYPREVVKEALKCNASAVIFAHNHPSGIAAPSSADRRITERLKDALALVDIRVLDHIVVGKECVSLAERGLL